MTREQLELLRSLIRAEIERHEQVSFTGAKESSAYAEAVFEQLVKSFNEHEADPR